MPSAKGSWITTQSTTRTARCHRSVRKISDWNSRVKLSKPMKSVGSPPKPFHLKPLA